MCMCVCLYSEIEGVKVLEEVISDGVMRLKPT